MNMAMSERAAAVPQGARQRPRLHGVGMPGGLHGIAEYAFDLAAHGVGTFVVVELDADALLAVGLGAAGGDPDHLAGDWQLVGVIHQRQQHVDLVAHLVGPIGRNEQAPAFHERQVGGI